MKWLDKKMGSVQMNLTELHSMLAGRQFKFEGQDIHEVELFGDTDDNDERAVGRIEARTNQLLDLIDDVDCEFHDDFEAYCDGIAETENAQASYPETDDKEDDHHFGGSTHVDYKPERPGVG